MTPQQLHHLHPLVPDHDWDAVGHLHADCVPHGWFCAGCRTVEKNEAPPLGCPTCRTSPRPLWLQPSPAMGDASVDVGSPVDDDNFAATVGLALHVATAATRKTGHQPGAWVMHPETWDDLQSDAGVARNLLLSVPSPTPFAATLRGLDVSTSTAVQPHLIHCIARRSNTIIDTP